MIRRWISDVPSKIVKILDYGAVFRRSATLPGAVVSARIQHRLFEGGGCFRLPRVVVERGLDAGQEGTVDLAATVGTVVRRVNVGRIFTRRRHAAGASEVHSCADLRIRFRSMPRMARQRPPDRNLGCVRVSAVVGMRGADFCSWRRVQ